VCSFISDSQYKADLNAKAYQYFPNMEEKRNRVEEKKKRVRKIRVEKYD
jgi:hypothetical protein